MVESGLVNWNKVLGSLKAGQWTWAKVPQGKNCHVDLRGKYADGKSADVPNVDICADKTVDLVNYAPKEQYVEAITVNIASSTAPQADRRW